MKEIPLTKGYVALVDDEDFDLVSAFKWHAMVIGFSDHLVYAARNAVRADGSKFKELMHRMITGAPSGEIVDHVDRNGLNNTRANFRIVTHHQNMINRRMHKNNKSGYRGVRQRGSKWTARITANGREHYLGIFINPEDAARAYDRAAITFFGDLAQPNLPSDSEHAA